MYSVYSVYSMSSVYSMYSMYSMNSVYIVCTFCVHSVLTLLPLGGPDRQCVQCGGGGYREVLQHLQALPQQLGQSNIILRILLRKDNLVINTNTDNILYTGNIKQCFGRQLIKILLKLLVSSYLV